MPIIDKIKKILVFNEPEEKEVFILKEDKKTSDKRDKKESSNQADISNESKGFKQFKGPKIVPKLENSLEYIRKVYNIPTNSDVIIREFNIVFNDKTIDAFIIYMDGMTDRKFIGDNILQPLMIFSNMNIKNDDVLIGDYIKKHLITANQIVTANTYQEVVDDVNFGGCALFVDGMDMAYVLDVKSWEHRTVSRPNTELVIRGPQEGFNEILRVNTALVRKILKDEDLTVENVSIGERSKTPCSLMYIKDIANDSLVAEVRKRLKGIKIDYLIDSGELEQLIEDSSILPLPQILATERPDRVASYLTKGKVAIMMHGSPFCLVVPATSLTLTHSAEDQYMRFPYTNFLRLIRLMAVFLALLLPGVYLAITNYHQEMLPTDLLLAIAASREKVPFPAIIEILIMELSFEMIREAGIRIPGPIGPTLGIIGALILGQAAVAANIISPILIIIVAVTGIGSFAVPNFSMAFGFRLLRFMYIFLGGFAGFLGIVTGLFVHTLLQVNQKTFGVPFMAPVGPITKGVFSESFSRSPIWKQENRPDFLNPKDDTRQPHISREWKNVKGDKEKE